MAGKPQSSIRLAINACIVRCSQSRSAALCLAEFIQELGQMGWDYESLRHVEQGALQALRTNAERERLLA